MKPSQRKLVEQQFEDIKNSYSEDMLDYLSELVDSHLFPIIIESIDDEGLLKEVWDEYQEYQEYNCCKGAKKIIPPESKL